MKKAGLTLRPGVTLPEMMVALAITVGMMLAASMVFKASTDASGRAMASNDMMAQVRALTGQLQKDFAGLMADMPLAIIFEEDPCGGARMDRIVFFATGDFRTLNGNEAGNIARIFYGQGSGSVEAANSDEYAFQPWRRVLTRRQKIMNLNGPLAVNTGTWDASGDRPFEDSPTGLDVEYEVRTGMNDRWDDFPAIDYDNVELESSTVNYWQNEPYTNFEEHHFKTYDVVNKADVEENPPLDKWNVSMVHRSSVGEIQGAIAGGALEAGALQRLYVLPDVTDFTIQVWFEGADDWFPNERELTIIYDFSSGEVAMPYDAANYAYAFYWNAAGDTARAKPWHGIPIDNIDWRPESDIEVLARIPDVQWSTSNPLNIWPRALRFSFRLRDRNRRHFPEGRRFEYIVRLPERE